MFQKKILKSPKKSQKPEQNPQIPKTFTEIPNLSFVNMFLTKIQYGDILVPEKAKF